MANTAAKKITYDGKPVQVESAIRDSTGKIINQTYQEKPEVIEYTVSSATPTGTIAIAIYDGTYTGAAGHVRFRMELQCTSVEQTFEAELSWSGNPADPVAKANTGSIAILSSSNKAINIASNLYLCVYSDSLVIAIRVPTSKNEDINVKTTILESSKDLTWNTNWNTTITIPANYREAQLELGSYSNYAGASVSAQEDMAGNQIGTFYVTHAEYTVPVSTSQEYHKPFSELALGRNDAGTLRIPRQVEIYDASGNQIQTDVKIDTINNKITIYPTAVSPAQTWTVRVTAW